MASRLFYGVLLALILSVLWLLLSGYWFKPLLVGFGVLAVTVALVTTANIPVVRIAMAPDLNIKPVMTRVAVSAKSDMARTTYANSITLTPGTVTVEVEETGFLVHALTEEFADQDAFRDMERRSIEAVEGRKALAKPRGEAGS